jgi:hypothetical protein
MRVDCVGVKLSARLGCAKGAFALNGDQFDLNRVNGRTFGKIGLASRVEDVDVAAGCFQLRPAALVNEGHADGNCVTDRYIERQTPRFVHQRNGASLD